MLIQCTFLKQGVTLVHFKDHQFSDGYLSLCNHNQQNDAPRHHFFTQHPWLQMFPSFTSSLVRLQLKRTLTFSFFQQVILMFVVNLAGCSGLGGFQEGKLKTLSCYMLPCKGGTTIVRPALFEFFWCLFADLGIYVTSNVFCSFPNYIIITTCDLKHTSNKH